MDSRQIINKKALTYIQNEDQIYDMLKNAIKMFRGLLLHKVDADGDVIEEMIYELNRNMCVLIIKRDDIPEDGEFVANILPIIKKGRHNMIKLLMIPFNEKFNKCLLICDCLDDEGSYFHW